MNSRSRLEWEFATDRFRERPVIAMTANVMARYLEKAIEAGMNAHIGKPVNAREMVATMAKRITPHRDWREMA